MTRMADHGGNRRASSKRTGIPEDKIIDFSASVSPRGVPGTVMRAMKRSMGDLPHYPDPYSEQFAQTIEKRYRLERGSVICGNGSTELMYLLPRALRPRTVLLLAPTFSEYERACRVSGASRIVHQVLRPENDFVVSPDDYIRAMTGGRDAREGSTGKREPCDMAFLCNPNNPTGQLLGKRAVMDIAAAAQELKCRLVVDEAFADFSPGSSVINEVRNNPYLIVLRSLTKFYALAGLRVGYGVLPRPVAETMRRYQEPWTVNTLAQQAGIAALGDGAYARAALKEMKQEKAFIEKQLVKMGIGFIPSRANYYLIRMRNARRVVADLEGQGILVRDCSNFAGLDETYVRFAVRSRKENRILMRELSAVTAWDEKW